MRIGLISGSTGPEVVRLHRVLEAAGLVIDEREKERQEFGASTLEALLAFQRQRGLPVRGEIDAETYAALIVVEAEIVIEPGPPRPKPPNPADRGTAQITLVDEDGEPVTGVRILLFAQAVRGERQLGDAATGAAGDCAITYLRPAPLNLMARAYDDTLKVIAQSSTYFSAPQQLQISFTTAADGIVRTPSAYTALVAAVAVQLQDVPLTGLKEDSQTHELTFLANAIGAEFDRVAYLYIAQALGSQHGVSAQTFFGIFCAGVPAPLRAALGNLPEAGIDGAFTAQVLAGVLAHARGSLDAVLTAAVASNILPASYAPVREAQLTLLDGLRVQSVASAPYVSGKTSLSDLLAAGQVSQAAQAAFTTAYADTGGLLGPTWQALRANSALSAADLTALDTTLGAGEMLAGNVPLVKDTLSRISQGSLASIQNLALLDESDWIARITSVDPDGTSVPPALPGESPQDRIARFATRLTERFTARYPTTAFAGGLSKAGDSAFAATRDGLVPFIVDHPTFAFERTNIDHFVAAQHVQLPADALADLKTAQRLFRVTPTYATVNALRAAGHQSAQSVYFTGRQPFVSGMTGAFGSASAAETAYANAHMAYATALMAYGRFNGAFAGPGLTAFGPAQPTPQQVTDLPDLAALFGSLDYFQCEDCQSVYSPAAYLVDLLQYLTQFTASGGAGISTARDALLARRPDVQYVALNCANTNTTLPYIDVVNEILEAVVAPPAGQVTVIDTTGTSAERQALPQQVSQAAYAAIAGQVFPLSLPFDLPFAQAQAYIAAMGTSRAAVLALFAGNPVAAGAAPSIAAAALGINPEMQQVINGSDGHQDWERWGWPVHDPAGVRDPDTGQPYSPNPADWVAALSKVPVLLNRSGLTLQQLYQLLEVAWVTESGVTIQAGFTTIAGVQVLSSSADDMTFTGLTGDVLDRANRFLRLWTASGLQMWELDWALGSGTLTDDFLVFLSGAIAVRNSLSLPFQEVLSFWMPLGTTDVTNHLGDEDTVTPSTYAEVFRNPAVLATAGAVFVPVNQSVITGASDTAPIEITTAAPHGYQDGQQVSIVGVLGNTAANGTFIISVTGAATFTLNGSAGNGAWTSDGTVTGVLSGNPIIAAGAAGPPTAEQNAITASLGLSADDISAILAFTGAANALSLDTLNVLRCYQRLAAVLSLDMPSLIDWIQLTAGQPFDGTPADTLEFCRRLAVLQGTRLGAYDIDYLLRDQSASLTSLAFTQTQATAVLQAIRDAIAKLPPPAVIPVTDASIQAIFVAALAAATGTTATVVTPLLLSTGILPLSQATITLLLSQTSGVDPTVFPALINGFTAVAKGAALYTALGPTAGEFAFAIQAASSFGWLDPSALPLAPVAASPYAAFEALLTAFRLDRRQPARTTKLFDVLGQWLPPGALPPDVPTAVTVLAPALNASQADVLAIATALGATVPALTAAGLPGSLADMATLGAIAAALDVAARYRLGGATLVQLAAVPATPASAAAAFAAVQAQYAQEAWLAAIGPVEDSLREARRDALVAYLLGPGQAAAPVAMFTTDDIYNYYLIDPEMSSCALTTRLLEASLAIQQFMQQCQLNIVIAGVTVNTSQGPWSEWSWRQQFRLWQAARMTFCYPENYLLPDARPDASPFFTDLGNDLRQANLTEAIAEAAMQNYLRSLLGVANLTVAGHYTQQRADGSYVLHVFAHTGGTPDQWYYRTRTGGTADTGSWAAWQSLNLDISSQQLLPVIWDQRLYLIWPVFRQISEKANPQSVPAAGGGAPSPAPQKFWSVELAMSQLSAGQWQVKQTLPQKLYWNTADSQLAFAFRGGQDSSFNLQLSAYACLVEEAMTAALQDAEQGAQHGAGPGPYVASVQGSSATVQLSYQVSIPGWLNFGPVYTLVASTSASGLITTATLPMPESPLSVTEWPPLLPGSQYMDLSQDPTYALIATAQLTGTLTAPTGYGFSGQNLVPGNYTLINAGSVALNVLCARSNPPSPSTLEVLGSITSPYIVPPVQEQVFDSTHPFFVGDVTRSYLVQPTFYTVSSYPAGIPDVTSYGGQWSTLFTFSTFYHPYARTFLRELEIGGISQLMSRNLQLNPQTVRGWTPPFDFAALYQPRPVVVTSPYPGAPGAQDPGETALDFALADAGAYSLYNWETFYYAPMLISSQLLQNQQFSDALAWLEYIFDPADASGGPTPQRYWEFAPLNAMNAADWIAQQIQNLLTTLAADTQQGISDTATATAIQNWMSDPYDPNAVASVRIAALGKATVMQFLNTIIAWGDWYYAQYTAEMVSYAEQLYVLADMLLGPQPRMLRLADTGQGAAPPTYADLKNLDLFSNALVSVENVVVAPEPPASVVNGTTELPTLPQFPVGTADTPLFCIPPNPQLLAYWDTVAQRLDNIRHCRNLQGQPRPLPLYAPAISPLSLIEEQAAGAGAAGGTPPAPIYRFSVYSQKAVELTSDVRAYGALILSALEKQDAESLALLRANQETNIANMMLGVKAEQITETQDQVTALQNQQAVVQIRYNFYSTIAFMNAWEIAAMALQGAALIANGLAVILDITTGIVSLIPTVNVGVSGFGGTPTVTASFGGDNVARSAASFATVSREIAGILSESGGMAATMGGYQRRMDEWNLQAALAGAELTQVSSQITAAQDRVNIAQQELSVANTQAANAQTVSDFLTNKFTNTQLYSWMSSQLTTVYTQAYQLAYAYALQAQNAYQYELGSQDSFIQFGYWNSQYQGLTAGESLLFDLRRMEAAYVANNAREQELTKHVSLALTSPCALVMLRETGTCQIALDEVLFEYDHPGQYLRRLRSVALTIPCVTGPYTGVNATLTLTSAMVRTQPAEASYRPQPAAAQPNDPTVVVSPAAAAGTQTIVTSTGQTDSGLFEVNLRDERWLPFEGQGAISTWNLTLDPRDNNFDFTTITDVILHVRYTARGAGDQTAANNVREQLKPSDPRTILISVRNTFPDSWYAFFNPGAQATEQTLSLPLTARVFPYTNLGDGTAQIQNLAMYLVLSVPAGGDTIAAGLTGTAGGISLAPMAGQTTAGDPIDALTASVAFAPSLAVPQTPSLTVPLANIPADLGTTVNGQTLLDPDKVEDLLLVITYAIG
jgi:hypothetical protein